MVYAELTEHVTITSEDLSSVRGGWSSALDDPSVKNVGTLTATCARTSGGEPNCQLGYELGFRLPGESYGSAVSQLNKGSGAADAVKSGGIPGYTWGELIDLSQSLA